MLVGLWPGSLAPSALLAARRHPADEHERAPSTNLFSEYWVCLRAVLDAWPGASQCAAWGASAEWCGVVCRSSGDLAERGPRTERVKHSQLCPDCRRLLLEPATASAYPAEGPEVSMPHGASEGPIG